MNLESIFKNKRVLITGHTGFKGSWLSVWLNSLGAEIEGISLDIPSAPSNFEASSMDSFIKSHIVDIRDREAIKKIINGFQPDFIFHLAAKALVRYSYQNPLEAISTNAIGTANILDIINELDKEVVAVMITSDKVYANSEWSWGYRETDLIGGKDPYSASKGMAELAIHSYLSSCFNNEDSNVRLGIARAGNVIGGGDWAADRIVPDSMRAASTKKCLEIRSPNSTRPWQHLLEPLSGYLCLAANLACSKDMHGQAYNFGPPADQNYSVEEIITEMSKYWSEIEWKDCSDSNHLHEAGLLKLSCDKALADLEWQPTLGFPHTVKMTVDWYKEYYANGDNKSMLDFTLDQILEYTDLATSKKIKWASDD